MKKILGILILTSLLIGCYDDYITDYDYDGVYFAYQTDVRTFVVGEGMKIEIGAALGGVRENDRDRNVSYELQNSLITPEILAAMKGGQTYIKESVLTVSTLLPIPSDYYTLSDNSKMVIKKGNHMGSIVMKVDSAKFLADPATLVSNYAIPLYITSADADTILEPKRYAVIGLKYENMLFGNYNHGGITIVKNPSGTPIDTLYYYSAVNQPETKVWKLTTVAPNALVVNGYSDKTSTTKKELMLTLNGSALTVGSATGSTFTYEADGPNTYNQAKLLQKRQILLNYKYVDTAGNTYSAKDTLYFRNRIRDGINEWQDENPANYK